MPPGKEASAGSDQRTLIRNARQLLTLYGASGPRCGPAMSELRIIPNGALLIHKGVIEEAGPARRIENLATARHAREIDAAGRIVMPAFCDPDMTLVVPPPIAREDSENPDDGAAIRVISKRNIEIRAAAAAAERSRYGCITAGSNTACARDLKNTIKVLRAQKALQLKPLRIRSIYSYCPVPAEELTQKWLPAIRKDKLAAVIDLALEGSVPPRDAAILASGSGLALRIRSHHRLEPAALLLALSGGAISIVAPPDALTAFTGTLAKIGCVRVVPAFDTLDDEEGGAANIRAAIDGGAAVALTPGRGLLNVSSSNMQFLLYLAVAHLGMSAEEAITATTYNAACSLRMSHVTGSLEPGKWADAIIMDVADYRDLPRRAGHHDVNMVMRAGQIVSRRNGLTGVEH